LTLVAVKASTLIGLNWHDWLPEKILLLLITMNVSHIRGLRLIKESKKNYHSDQDSEFDKRAT
jgi:hypothetical protein